MNLTTQQLDAHGRATGLTLKPLIRAIPRECFQLSPWRAWGTLLRCVLVIAALELALARVIQADLPLYVQAPALGALWFFTGCAFTGLYILAHDCGHYAFSKRRWVNDVLGELIMASLLGSYTSWKLIHNQHHVHSNVRGKDFGWPPGMKTAEELADAPWIARALNWVAYGSPIGLAIAPWLSRVHFWLLPEGSVRQFERIADRDRRRLRRSLALIVLVSGGILTGLALWGGLWAVVALYLAPAAVGASLGLFLILLQHSSEDALVFDPQDHTPFRSQVVGTYDTRYPRWLEWLVLDVNLHLVHHLTPRVPWYHLRRATAALKAEFPECVQERAFRWSMLPRLWARPALERHPEGYLVRVPAPTPEPRRAPELPAELLQSRA